MAQAVEIALTSEATEDRIRTMESEKSNPTTELVLFASKTTTRRTHSKKPESKDKCCSRCGDTWHSGDPKKECKAWGKKCNNCGIFSHFGKVCKNPNSRNRVYQFDEDGAVSSEESIYVVDQHGSGKKYVANLYLSCSPAQVQSENVLTRCQIDTGSTSNVIPKRFLEAIVNKASKTVQLVIQPSQSTWSMYNNSSLKLVGHVCCGFVVAVNSSK